MSVEKLKKMVDDSNNIVFFGGAGVSTESDIPDFRSATGIYSGRDEMEYPPEYLLSRTFFYREPEKFYNFYKRNMIHRYARPNDAHIALAELERQGKLKGVITQNVDGLHQQAGSEKVYEIHGSISRNYCLQCYTYFDLDYIMSSDGVPECKYCEGMIKPDVVLYEESLDMSIMQEAIELISEADILIIGGTSLTVNPAADLVTYYGGDKLVIINQTPTPYDNDAKLVFHNSIGEILGELI